MDRILPHLPSLFRAARRLTRDPTRAEDLVQDTLVRALEKQDQVRDPRALRGWLHTVQRSVHFNQRRGLRARLEVLDGGRSAAPEPTGDLEREILESTLDEALSRALEQLPEELREALWLREVEGLTYQEIAQVRGCPVGTVRSRLSRARRAMCEALEGGEDARVRTQVG